jgi:uncharacterized protein (DUF433 family)
LLALGGPATDIWRALRMSVLEGAFTADHILQLTGLTTRQLRHLEDTGVIRPSLSRPTARGRGRPRMYDFRDLVKLKTAARLRQRDPLASVAELMRDVARLDVRRVGEVERRRGALGGKPLIAGTRIPVATVQRLVREGLGAEQIREFYPDLTDDDIRAAIAAKATSRSVRAAV